MVFHWNTTGSGPDPGGQGLPLGIWAGLQEFFNICEIFKESAAGKSARTPTPPCGVGVHDTRVARTPTPQGGVGVRADFPAADFLKISQNIEEFLEARPNP